MSGALSVAAALVPMFISIRHEIAPSKRVRSSSAQEAARTANPSTARGMACNRAISEKSTRNAGVPVMIIAPVRILMRKEKES